MVLDSKQKAKNLRIAVSVAEIAVPRVFACTASPANGGFTCASCARKHAFEMQKRGMDKGSTCSPPRERALRGPIRVAHLRVNVLSVAIRWQDGERAPINSAGFDRS